MELDLNKYKKQQPSSGGIDLNKYRKAPAQPQQQLYAVPEDKAYDSQQRMNSAKADQIELDKEADKGFFRRFGKSLAENLVPSEIGLGNTFASLGYSGSKAQQGVQDSILSAQDQQTQLVKAIREAEAAGRDATGLKRAYNESVRSTQKTQAGEAQRSELPSNLKALGQIGGTALDLLTAGTYSKAKTGAMGSFRLANQGVASNALARFIPSTAAQAPTSSLVKGAATAAGMPELGAIAGQQARGLLTKAGAANIATGAGIGYASDVTLGLQGYRGEDREGAAALIPGLGTAIGTAIPLTAETAASFRNWRNPDIKISNKRNTGLEDLRKKYPKVDRAFKAGDRRGVNVQQALSETNLLNGAVDTDGKITSQFALENFDEFIAPLQGEVKKTLLEEGRSVNLNTLSDDAVDFINKSDLSDGQKAKLQREIASQLDAFQQFRGMDVPVASVHDTKVALGSANNYLDPAKDAIDKEAARFFKEVVENNSFAMDVKGYNEGLSQLYAIRDGIVALDRTRVAGGRLGKYFSSVIGAGVGASVGGAGLSPITTLLGAEIGSRVKGSQMSRALGGDISKGLNLPTGMMDAKNPRATGRDIISDVVVPPRQDATGDLNLGNKTVDPENRTGVIPVKRSNAKPPKTLEETRADLGVQVAKKEVEEDMLRTEISILEETVMNNPARQLMKFRGNGLSNNSLAQIQKNAESTGGKSKQLDSMVTELGYKNMDEAQAAIDQYQKDTKRLADLKDRLKTSQYGEAFAGGVVGFEQDEDGNYTFNAENAALGMIGLGVAGSMSRNKAAGEVAKKINNATRDELAKFVTVVKGGGVTTTNQGIMQFKAVDDMTEAQAKQAFEDGLRFLEFDTANMNKLDNASPGKIATFFESVLAVPPEAKGLGSVTPKKAAAAAAPTGTPDPRLKTKREVIAKDMAGNKVIIPAGTVIDPLVDGGKINIMVDGKNVAIPKNQYENLKGQSDVAVASKFAPELEGTVESVRGAKNYANVENGAGYDELPDDIKKIVDNHPDAGDGDYGALSKLQEDLNKAGWDMEYGLSGEIEEFFKKGAGAEALPTKYSQYTLPGGEDYREIVVQAPLTEKGKFMSYEQFLKESKQAGLSDESVIRKRYNEFKSEAENKTFGNQTYKSSHWDETNPLFHLRMNDRTWDGKKVTFMEEAQSDWARDGREKGFANDKGRGEFDEYVDSLRKKYKTDARIINQRLLTPEEKTKYQELFDGIQDFGDGVPYHPLLKNWQVPGVKKGLLDAVDRDADVFAWINGAQTSERYKLSTQVDNVKWEIPDDNYGKFIDLDTKEHGSQRLFLTPEGTVKSTIGANGSLAKKTDGKKLDEVLGKGMADSIMSKETGELSGDGLNFGGEWAYNLYDKQVRDIVKKLTGAEVKTVDMGLGIGREERFRLDGTQELATTKTILRGDTITSKDNEQFYVLDKNYGKGETRIIPVREVRLQVENDYDLYQKYLPDGTDVSIEKLNEAYYNAIDDGVFKDSTYAQTVKLDEVGKQLQQYIELTPEVKAKIRSEAPKFEMPVVAAAALPLIFLMLNSTEDTEPVN